MLDVRRLLVLREVAAHGSLTAAAQAIKCSQSAVSQQMIALERELGVALLERNRDGSCLTPVGELLVEHAEAVFARLELAEGTLKELRGAVTGSLAVAAFSTAAAAILPAAVQRFTTRHPHVSLAVADYEPAHSLPLVKSREIDVALIYEYDLLPRSLATGVDTRLLVADPLLVVFPKGHPAASSTCVRLVDLVDERWVCGTPGSDSSVVFERACHGAGFEPSIGCRSDNFAVVRNLVAAGAGLAVVPGLARPQDDERVVVRAISEPPLSRRVLIATRSGTAGHPATQAIVEILHEVTEVTPA